MNIKADENVDKRYERLRKRHGKGKPQANGYRLSGFFAREQRVLLAALDQQNGPFLDIACGSGLMLAPLLNQGQTVYGLDYNMDACAGAQQNGITIVRGDAFDLPFAEGTIGQIANCQFLNQQTPEQTAAFITESARILKSGGQLVMLWRHARSLIHKSAHSLFTIMDRVNGQPSFPQYEHPMKEIKTFAKNAGLDVTYEAVTLPFFYEGTIPTNHAVANVIGASLLTVLKKP